MKEMNVLITTIIVRSGVLTHVYDLVRYLQELGTHVSVAVLISPQVTKRVNLPKQQQIRLLGPISQVPHCFYTNDSELATFALDRSPDIVHAHSPLCFNTSAALASKLCVPLVLTLHGITLWQKEYAAAFNAARQIIAIGPEVAKSAGKQHTQKIKVIRNGIDINYFIPKDSGCGPNQPLNVTWFGRVNANAADGISSLEKAVLGLKNQGLCLRAKAVGSTAGVTLKALEHCGWQDDPLPLLQKSHIVFGRGRALREAMACGNVGFLLGEGYGGIVKKEWFKDEFRPLSASLKHGYNKTDANQIMYDLQKLYENRDYLQELRREARDIAENFFDARKMVKAVFAAYQESI